MEIGFDSIEKISGYVAGRDWNIVQIRLMDENGKPDGYTEIDTEAIVCIDTESEYERYLEAACIPRRRGAGQGQEEKGRGRGKRHFFSFRKVNPDGREKMRDFIVCFCCKACFSSAASSCSDT